MGNDNGFDQELVADGPFGGAHRFADADLERPFGDRNQHDVHQADCCTEQGDQPDESSGQGDVFDVFRQHLGDVVAFGDIESLLLPYPVFADDPEEARSFTDSLVHLQRVVRETSMAKGTVRPGEILAHIAQRKHAHTVA